MDSNGWLKVSLIIFVIAAIPLFFSAFGLGWAKRWMAVGLHKLNFNHLTSRVHTVKP